MKSRWICLLVLYPFTALAGEGVQLDTLTVKADTAQGTCATARLDISGLSQSDASGHRHVITPQGSLNVRSGQRTLRVGQAEPFFLQDRTMIACVPTPQGKRLVVATFCDGRGCEPVEYLLIEPASAQVLAPTEGKPCTRACAEKLLGARLPSPLRDGF